MSRIASMKNAASREKREMRDDIAYSGTMIIIRITILRPNMSHDQMISAKIRTAEEKA